MSAHRLLTWAGLAVGVFGVGLVAGIVFGQSAPDLAARQVVREFVRIETVTHDVVGSEVVAPTSGGNEGTPRCGRLGEVDVDGVVAALDAGVAVIHARTEALADEVQAQLSSGDSPAWAVVTNGRIDTDVEATAWGVRMSLSRVDGQLLRAFVTGYAAQRGPLPDCASP